MRARSAVFNGTLAAVVVGVGIFGYSRLGTGTPAAAKGTITTVKRTNLVSSVSATGNVASGAVYNLTFATTGAVTEIDVKLGDVVTKGQTLAKIDDTNAKLALANAQAGLDTANANLASVQTGLSATERQQLDISTAQSQLSVTNAIAALNNARATAANDAKQSTLSLSQAQTALTNAQAQAALSLTNAQNAVNTAQTKLNTDTAASAPQSTLDADQAALNTANAQLSSTTLQNNTSLANAQNAVDNQTQNQSSTQLKDSQAIASAQRQLTSAQLSYQSTVAGNTLKLAPPTASAVAQAQAQVESAQSQLATAQKNENDTTLVAPIDGTITAMNGQVGSQSNQLTSSSSSASFMSVTNMSQLYVSAGFSETDAAKVKVGQAATLTFDALGGTTVSGQVTVLSPTATTVNNVITYSVQITLNNPDATVKPGMTANVAVVVDKRDGVLTLPSTAVSGRGTAGTVTVHTSSGNQTKRVVVGLRGDTAVEIASGLTEGEQVVILPVAASSTAFNAGRLGAVTGIGGGAVPGGGARPGG